MVWNSLRGGVRGVGVVVDEAVVAAAVHEHEPDPAGALHSSGVLARDLVVRQGRAADGVVDVALIRPERAGGAGSRSISRVMPWLMAMNESPMTATSLPRVVPIAQVPPPR